MQKRGIVIGDSFETMVRGLKGCNSLLRLSEFELRKFLLYWDKLDFPLTGLTMHDHPIQLSLQYLESVGVLQRTRIDHTFGSAGPGEICSLAEIMTYNSIEQTFDMHEKNEPGVWTMVEPNNNPKLDLRHHLPSVELELFNMIPVPHNDIPLNDILEFKEKHSDELFAFRAHFNDVYLKIASSGDIVRAKNAEIVRLENALRDLDKSMSGLGIRKTITSFRSLIALDFGSIASFTLGGIGASSALGVSPLVAGCASAGIAMTMRSKSASSYRKHNQPYQYLKSIRTELR